MKFATKFIIAVLVCVLMAANAAQFNSVPQHIDPTNKTPAVGFWFSLWIMPAGSKEMITKDGGYDFWLSDAETVWELASWSEKTKPKFPRASQTMLDSIAIDPIAYQDRGVVSINASASAGVYDVIENIEVHIFLVPKAGYFPAEIKSLSASYSQPGDTRSTDKSFAIVNYADCFEMTGTTWTDTCEARNSKKRCISYGSPQCQCKAEISARECVESKDKGHTAGFAVVAVLAAVLGLSFF